MAMRSLTPYSSGRELPSGLRQNPLTALRSEMDRLFDTFGMWPGDTAREVTPRIDICETDREVDIDAELPGLAEKDIDLTLAGDLLTIRGEKKSEHEEMNENYRLSERSYGSFCRQIALPFDADPKTVSAKFDKGVLHIAIPKPANLAAKTAKIPVKAN